MSEAAEGLQEPARPSVKEDAPAEFQGCLRPCWSSLKHTYAYGSCTAAGTEPREQDCEVSFIGPITRGPDGRNSVEIYDIPLIALLPWTRHLPLEERWELLDSVAASESPAKTVYEWKKTAEAWADPETLDVLTRELNDLEDYVEVSRPEGEEDVPGTREPCSISEDAAEYVAAQQILTRRKHVTDTAEPALAADDDDPGRPDHAP